MDKAKLSDMIGGWFVGDFSPVAHRSSDFEVGVKSYKAGAYDALHFHKIATEITVIISGRAEMAGKPVEAGDIITIHPGERSDFRAIEDTTLAVVKFPSVPSDKYMASDYPEEDVK